MDPNLMENHILMLRNDYNATNSSVGNVVVAKVLDNLLTQGKGSGILDIDLEEIVWKAPEFLDVALMDTLFDDEGLPRRTGSEEEYWALIKNPDEVILDYTMEICETVDGIVAANRDVLNDVINNYIVTNVEVVGQVPTHIMLTFKGAQVNDHSVRTSKTQSDKRDASASSVSS